MATFTDLGNYGVDPWAGIELNERTWYDPILRDIYSRASVYSQQVQMKVDLNGPVARTIFFNELIAPKPNIAPINARATDATRLHQDSAQRSVTVERHGNGMSVHREDEMFNYWQKNGQRAGLMQIMSQSLGQVIVDHLDLLARNEFFRHPYPVMGLNNVSGFNGLSTSTDKLTTDLVDQLWLYSHDVEKPYSALPQNFIQGDEAVCFTTAGAVYDLKREVGTGAGGLNFVDVNKYTEEGRRLLIKGELGMYRGTRFVDSPLAKLWNVGTITHQTTIKAAVAPGAGAPDPRTTKVEGARLVGQPNAVHYILVNDASGFAAGKKVSVHLSRHDGSSLTAYAGKGVLNGPLFDDPMKQDIEIHSIDTTGGGGAHKITFKEPYMMSGSDGRGLEADLGGSVYGYVTLGQTVHTALFQTPGMGNGLVAGVSQQPTIYLPPAVDDFMSIFRITYDMWIKFQLWEARAYNVVFLTGANSTIQQRYFR